MKVLLSIKPEFVEKILDGTKRYEFRKSAFKREGIKSVVIYSTMPVGKVVAEFEIKEVHQKSPDEIWIDTKDYSGISEDFFYEYFSGRDRAVAIEVGELKVYENPLSLGDLGDNITAPQSFRYI
ncbi:MAG: ASCH domain-containing protein [Bacteroidetes bacterium]|nr:MAG: ASCH domain-containing protein [Bacteroidota bacterium]